MLMISQVDSHTEAFSRKVQPSPGHLCPSHRAEQNKNKLNHLAVYTNSLVKHYDYESQIIKYSYVRIRTYFNQTDLYHEMAH